MKHLLLNRQLTAFVKPQVSRAGLQQVRAWPLAFGAQGLPPALAPAPCPLPTAIRGVPLRGWGGGRNSHLSPHALLCCLHFSHMCLLVRTSKFYSLLSALSKDMYFLHFNYERQVFIMGRPAPSFSYFILLPASPAFSFLHSHLLLFLLSPGVPALPLLSFFFCVGFGGLYLCRICFRDSLNVLICNYTHYLLLWWLFL